MNWSFVPCLTVPAGLGCAVRALGEILLAALKLWHLLAERIIDNEALPLDQTYGFPGCRLNGN